MESVQSWTIQQIGMEQGDGIVSPLCAPYESSGAPWSRDGDAAPDVSMGDLQDPKMEVLQYII